MKLDKKNISETKVELRFSLTTQEINQAETSALNILAKDLKVKGFRPGKAPLAVAKKEVDPSILADKTIEIAINQALIKALDENSLMPIDQPDVSIDKFVPGQLLDFKATFDVLPKAKLPNYKKLGVKPEIPKVTDGEIEETLAKLQKGFAEEKKVERKAKLGDKTIIDFTGIIDGKEFAGGKGTDYPLELGAGQFIPGFEEGIIGKKAGEEFDLNLVFPKDYHANEFKGKDVTFKTKLKEVKEISLPEINDEFAKKVAKFDKLDDLKIDIRKNLIIQKEEQLKQDFRNKVVDALAEKTKVEIPQSLLHDQSHAMIHDMEHQLSHYGQTMEGYLASINKTEEEWIKSEVEPAAEMRVKAGLALAELSKELKMTATDEEIEAELNRFQTQYQNSPEAMKQLEDPRVKNDIKNSIITNKAIDALIEFNS